MAANSGEKAAVARFRWDKEDKVHNLIKCLASYKAVCMYEGKDFNADKPKLYECLREEMAQIYQDEPNYFGPVNITANPFCFKSKDAMNENELLEEKRISQQKKIDKALIRRGYTRVQEKLKEIRQKFSEAVTSGRRSGSGKVILEFYDQLVQIWGGSPATEPLSAGICTHDINSVNVDDQREGQNPTAVFDEYNNDDDDDEDDDELGPAGGTSPCSDEKPEQSASVSSGKRKSSSPIPKLVDDKRKHLERKLSAAQRDQLLLKEAKEDAQLKRDIAEAIRQSNESFSNSIQQMSNSMLQVAQGLTKSIEMMTTAMVAAPQHTPAPFNIHPQYGNFQHVNNYTGSAGFPFDVQYSSGQKFHGSETSASNNKDGQERYHQF